MKNVRTLLTLPGLVLFTLIAGCVYIPPLANEDTGIDPASFEIGRISRNDVLDVLGEPLINDGRFIVDQLYTSQGGVSASRPGWSGIPADR